MPKALRRDTALHDSRARAASSSFVAVLRVVVGVVVALLVSDVLVGFGESFRLDVGLIHGRSEIIIAFVLHAGPQIGSHYPYGPVTVV